MLQKPVWVLMMMMAHRRVRKRDPNHNNKQLMVLWYKTIKPQSHRVLCCGAHTSWWAYHIYLNNKEPGSRFKWIVCRCEVSIGNTQNTETAHFINTIHYHMFLVLCVLLTRIVFALFEPNTKNKNKVVLKWKLSWTVPGVWPENTGGLRGRDTVKWPLLKKNFWNMPNIFEPST